MTDTIVRLIIAAVALAIAFFVYRTWQDKRHSPGWPQVEGVVLESRVVEVREPQSERNNSGSSETRWKVSLKYRYTVDGIEYTGTRVTVEEQTHGSEAAAREQLRAYEPGNRVTVHYDPGQPRSSVLIPG